MADFAYKYLVWDGTISLQGTCNAALPGQELDWEALAVEDEGQPLLINPAYVGLTLGPRRRGLAALSRSQQTKVSVRLASVDASFRPRSLERGRLRIRIRLKRINHIESALVRIYRRFDRLGTQQPTDGLEADHMVYQEVLTRNQLINLPDTPPSAQVEQGDLPGDDEEAVTWKDAPFKIRVWVSSSISPEEMGDYAADRTDPEEERGRTAHDQSTWATWGGLGTKSTIKHITPSADAPQVRRAITADQVGVNLFTLRTVMVNGYSSGNGNGDIVLGRMVAQLVEEHVDADLVLISNIPTQMKSLFPEDAERIYWDGEDMNSQSKNKTTEADRVLSECLEPQLYIKCGPQGGRKKENYRTAGVTLAQGDERVYNARIPYLKVTEYGLANEQATPGIIDITCGLGLGEGEAGIFLAPDLHEHRNAGRAGLEALRDEEQALCDALLQPFESVAQYEQKAALYFGYCQGAGYINQFFDIALANAFANDLGHNIDFILPVVRDKSAALTSGNLKLDLVEADLQVDKGDFFVDAHKDHKRTVFHHRKIPNSQDLPDVRSLVFRRRRELLELADVGSVVAFTRAYPDGVVVYDSDEGGRVIRLFDFVRLSNTTFRKLLGISDALSLATGDQSWSEAVSADKDILYEQGTHKPQLYNAWLGIAEDQFGADAPVCKFMRLGSKEIFELGSGKKPDKFDNGYELGGLDSGVAPLLDGMAGHETRRAQFRELNQLLYDDYNCKNPVIEAVEEGLRRYPTAE